MRQHRKRRGGRLHSAGRILSSHPLADLSASEADHPVNTVYTIAFQEVQLSRVCNMIDDSFCSDFNHVSKFEANHLNPGEAVLQWGEGYIGKVMGQGKDKQHNGVLIVTGQRVAFYRKGFLGEVIETIPLKSITSIERKSTLGHRVIRIHTSHDDLEFKMFSKDAELALIEAIEAGRGVKTETPIAEPAMTHQDPYEQLKKLSELKESGIISEEEFQAKKSKLMELI
ncbi:MAG: PH domain-containing protein [Enterobacter asburiae]|nr:PH domain-containing protein [Enterobacter asburiae]